MISDKRIHADNLGFPEGPVGLPDGGVAFVDLRHACVRVHRDGETRVLAELPGAPNGMRLGPDGALYIANNGGIAPEGKTMWTSPTAQEGRIQRLELSGDWSDYATAFPGPRPNRPNDLVFTPEGEIVFTNPQNWEVMADDLSAYRGGQLMLARRDGTIELMAETEGFPNGLGFAPDGALIVAKTLQNRYERYEWNGGRPLGAPETFVQLDDRFFPDGMIWHEDRLWGAGAVGNRIAVLDQSGALVEMIETGRGTHPTNLCVHEGRLWVTFSKAGQLVSWALDGA
ncbi:MAG: SMP-30/gluconolactonase/LRE family protein [Pseudomonadota bacterium]